MQRRPLRRKKGRQVNAISDVESNNSSEEDLLTIEEVNSLKSKSSHKIYAKIEINRQRVKMLVDTGATCNVIPLSLVPKGTVINKTPNTLSMYSKSTITTVGTAKIPIINVKNQQPYKLEFKIIKGDYIPIIGLSSSLDMELIEIKPDNVLNVTANKQELTKEAVLHEYADVFNNELGCMKGQIHLNTDPNVIPTVAPPRRIPVAIKEKVKAEIDRQAERKVISPVEEPTEWVSSMTTVIKPDGSVRLCIDPQQLNTALKRCHYPLPTIEEILPELATARIFSKADLKEGFLQVELDDESSKLTTFQTPWGRYRYHRMPFGISPAPEIFQAKLDQNLEGLKGVYKIADDILITGQGDNDESANEDHDINMKSLLQRCRKNNIKLNANKFHFKCEEISFIGHRLTKDGLKPDPNKINAILNMPRPEDVPAIQRLLGMVKYLSKFLNNLSHLSEPLRRLTHKEVPWNWTEEQEKSFIAIKEAISSTPVLNYFDSSKAVEGSGDASSTGLGFVLTQDEHPITYASRSLSKAEQNYSQIEKELLAQVFGLEHNHQYVYGRPITLYTDHKPLVSISKKPLSSAPKRLQRLLLRLHNYDVDIKYKPGNEMYLADTLSRAYVETNQHIHKSETEIEVESIQAFDYIPMSEAQFTEIKEETTKDSTLQTLKSTILQGWPDDKSLVPLNIRTYFNYRDELAVQHGVIFKGNRCIVPKSLRAKIKEKLHQSHIGIQGCLRRAREVVYWPSMNQEISEYIEQCDICNSFAYKQQKEPLIVHDVPHRPWQKIGCDIFTVDQKDYLCTVDYYSGYFEIDKLDRKTGNVIIKKLKRHFATHGIPDEFFSDNGPPFDSIEFRDFAKQYEFIANTSSPHYPQSNGRVENAVKTAKRLLKKSKEGGNDFYQSLLDWRNTPTEGIGSSPAQRIFGRRTRTSIPTAPSLLQPEIPHGARDKMLKRKEIQTKFYNRNTKELPQLQPGDKVHVQTDNKSKWYKAKVQEQVDIRSYNIRTEDGRVYRRNRRHLRKSVQPTASKIVQEPLEDHYKLTSREPTVIQPSTAREQTIETTNSEPIVQPPTAQVTSSDQPTQITTRSGRAVKLPKHLEDYELQK